jgi:hypothetical protein
LAGCCQRSIGQFRERAKKSLPNKTLKSKAGEGLLPQIQTIQELEVESGIRAFDVIQKTPALAHEHQQPASAGMVLGVLLEVIRQLSNSMAQDRDLDFRRTGVLFAASVILD